MNRWQEKEKVMGVKEVLSLRTAILSAAWGKAGNWEAKNDIPASLSMYRRSQAGKGCEQSLPRPGAPAVSLSAPSIQPLSHRDNHPGQTENHRVQVTFPNPASQPPLGQPTTPATKTTQGPQKHVTSFHAAPKGIVVREWGPIIDLTAPPTRQSMYESCFEAGL